MQLRLVDYVLWFASPLLQAGVLLAMLRRGLYRDYPYFLNYTILAVASEPILFFLHSRSYTAYYYGYYVNLGLSVIISFAVLQEIFRDAFRPYEALRDLGVILFRWSGLVVLLVGVMWAINARSSSDSGVVMDIINLADRSVRIMQCGLVFFLLLFSEYLGLSRRSFLFGVSLGFGMFAAINMLVFTGLTYHGILHQSTLSKINSAGYLVAVAIWFGYTLVAAPSKSKVLLGGPVIATDWEPVLADARGPAGADSLLDNMDVIVERLLHPPQREESKIKISPSHTT